MLYSFKIQLELQIRGFDAIILIHHDSSDSIERSDIGFHEY